MLLDLLKQDSYLTAIIAIVGMIWFAVLLRNVWVLNKSTGEYQQQYQRILDAEEFKVKGKFEQ